MTYKAQYRQYYPSSQTNKISYKQVIYQFYYFAIYIQNRARSSRTLQ